MGETAKKYNLYSKITGAQRIDFFGAPKHQLPDIWEELGSVGLESGHAYGKALRTVKSCVGSTWCRFGVQDSVSFAIRVENRYKGVRSPHKMKSAVSGCVRECAEAQGKVSNRLPADYIWFPTHRRLTYCLAAGLWYDCHRERIQPIRRR